MYKIIKIQCKCEFKLHDILTFLYPWRGFIELKKKRNPPGTKSSMSHGVILQKKSYTLTCPYLGHILVFTVSQKNNNDRCVAHYFAGVLQLHGRLKRCGGEGVCDDETLPDKISERLCSKSSGVSPKSVPNPTRYFPKNSLYLGTSLEAIESFISSRSFRSGTIQEDCALHVSWNSASKHS